MSLKVAIVGCGKIADAHVEVIRMIPSVELRAVCDLEPIMADQLAARFSVPHRYSDLAKMLDAEGPDVLHITTPPQSHLAIVKQAVAAGCHVFLEKPVALRHCDVEAIIAANVAAKRKLTVNYWPRFEAVALELRRMYEAGVLGDPVHVESSIGYDLAGEFGTAIRRNPEHWVHQLPGKLFQNVLDHVLNRITPFMGDERPLIQAVAYRRDTLTEETGGGELLDELRVIIRGTRASAYATFSANARPVGQTLRVYGTKNTAFVDFAARTVVLERRQTFSSALGRLIPSFLIAKDYFQQGLKNANSFSHAQFHFFDGMRRLLTEFYLCIEKDTPPPIDYEEILRVSAMMERIFEQAYPGVRS
ncbi:MAG: Gfo/Idh/MocA family oxidoreductase [Terracidiphilus sp.]